MKKYYILEIYAYRKRQAKEPYYFNWFESKEEAIKALDSFESNRNAYQSIAYLKSALINENLDTEEAISDYAFYPGFHKETIGGASFRMIIGRWIYDNSRA